MTARDSLLDHIWEDLFAVLKALGRAPHAGRSDAAAAAGARGGQAGDTQDWDMALCQERCLRSAAEVKTAVLQLQARPSVTFVTAARTSLPVGLASRSS